MIELNADIGEGGADAQLMPYVDRVSIACGGHAGDAAFMRAALLLARESGAKAGAHPSYPDPAFRAACHASLAGGRFSLGGGTNAGFDGGGDRLESKTVSRETAWRTL